MEPGDADFICSAMNLPIPVGYWSKQGNFCAVEELVGKAQLETTALEMHKACDAEIYQTLNVHERVDWADKGCDFRWWKSLSGTERMAVQNMPCLTVS